MRQSLKVATDPFSDFLEVTRAHSTHTAAVIAGGRWAIAVPPPETLKFWAIARGHCWLTVERDAPIKMERGDVFMLAAARKHVLASDLKAKPRPLDEVLARRTGPVVHLGTGDDTLMLGGMVALDRTGTELLLATLPPVIHIRAASRLAQTLHWLMDQLVSERIDGLPGAEAASSQLAHLMFIQILRAHYASPEPHAASWVRAMGDARLAPALRLIHGDPGRSWRLEELAHAAAMSRATFAAYFKQVAGIAPMAYLTEWRMRLAAKALREDRATVRELATTLGYSSESSFSHAFKRVTGDSPRACRDAGA
jgi:AraC-like DNA-binding protein